MKSNVKQIVWTIICVLMVAYAAYAICIKVGMTPMKMNKTSHIEVITPTGKHLLTSID